MQLNNSFKWTNILFGLILGLANLSICHKHSSEPLLLLISFDGFRWDYLQKYNLTNFNYLKENGAYADYIYNAFTTVTFPNHWTIVTGLYEETHGIIQNTMFDPQLNETFNISIFGKAENEWFAQNKITEPIWVTNQKAGKSRLSAAEWVASDMVVNDQPIISIPYNHSRPFKDLIDQFIDLYNNETNPINFGALYFDEPDHTGHIYGPYSKQMKEKLESLDDTLGYLIEQLKDHHLFDKLNIIITSDHGMEEISKNKTIFLDQHIDTNLFNAYGSRALFNIFLKNESNLDLVYNQLKKIDGIDVYRKHEIPESLHYKNNNRVGQIVIVSKLGYSIYVKTQDIDWTLNNGDHGYYNNEKSMLPIFISHGPVFKNNYKSPTFNNVDIYPLMCYILGIQPAINNGSLETVIDLLKVKYVEAGFNIYFLGLALIPLVMIITLLVCLMCSNKRANENISMTTHGYTTLRNTDDAVVDFDDDEITK